MGESSLHQCVPSCIFQRLSFSFYIAPLLIYVRSNAAEISLLQLLSGLSDRRLDFDACSRAVFLLRNVLSVIVYL